VRGQVDDLRSHSHIDGIKLAHNVEGQPGECVPLSSIRQSDVPLCLRRRLHPTPSGALGRLL
jgi:hypothetical protein